MQIYPLVDWFEGATASGAGSAWNPANAPITNAQNEFLGEPARLSSSFLGKTFIDFDLGEAKTLRGISALGVESGSGSTAVDMKYRILASSSATIVEQVAPSSATFTNYTSSPAVGDIDDDPDNDDSDWLEYDGTGETEVQADFSKTVADFAGSGSHTTTYVRVLAGTSESTGSSTSHNMVVKVVNATSPAEITLDTVAVTTPSVDGGELFTVSMPYSTISAWTGTDTVEFHFEGAETSGDAAVLGAVRLYIPGQNIVTNGDTGWLDAWPTSFDGSETITQNRTVDCHGVFSADVSARYVRVWFDNSAASFVDVGTVRGGDSLSPARAYNHREGTQRAYEDTSIVVTAESGQPYVREGIRRKIARWNLHFLTEAEVWTLETNFDRVRGSSSAYVVIPDEDTQSRFFYEACYGFTESLEPNVMAGRYDNSGSMDLRYQRVLTMRQVAVD